MELGSQPDFTPSNVMPSGSCLIQTARNANRDVTAAELDALVAADRTARDALVEAIEKAKAEGG